MSINSELDRIASEVVSQVYEEIAKITDRELQYSDIDLEGDDYYEAHYQIIELVHAKIKEDI
jgi:PAB1-binding protein PBP1|tara:strand:- start:123 stop:308 length:186 start_codon:yes stop_codon:yes gene_type:complete